MKLVWIGGKKNKNPRKYLKNHYYIVSMEKAALLACEEHLEKLKQFWTSCKGYF